MRNTRIAPLLLAAALLAAGGAAAEVPPQWTAEWPRTDFSNATVDLSQIRSGGPPKDGIPSIDDPAFVAVAEADGLAPDEPVMSLSVGGEARAYPVRILMWHEIVNDVVAGTPVAVTYCPLCNAALVFERTLGERTLEFGTTGKLRHSDLVMYDRQTETWWQQFTGEAIAGELAGERLALVPSRMEPFEAFAGRHPDGAVLVQPADTFRAYGENPYEGYDSADRPFLYDGSYDGPVPPLAYVVAVGDEAWPLETVREKGRIEHGDIVIEWRPGMRSALDTRRIAQGRDLGAVEVTRHGEPALFHTPFAFAFAAFNPDGVIHAN
jgi:hypothetical protein